MHTLTEKLRRAALAAALALPAASAAAQSDTFVDVGTGDDPYAGEDDRGGLRVSRGSRAVPPTHTVRRGDTLWDITEYYFRNPWEWPRVWSYNPEVTNPHWIYPDDVLRLLPAGGAPVPSSGGGVSVAVRRRASAGTVYLREQGYLDPEALRTAGEIVGSPTDHMLLTPYDQVYVRFDELEDGRAPAGEYTVFRELAEGEESLERETGDAGTLVRILGAVRIEEWDPERSIARATLIESLEPIERGFTVAAVPRRFTVVPPVTSDRDLETEVVASMRPSLLVGSDQIVFVPVGEEDGVREGNRFLIVRRGDGWRRTLEDADIHDVGSAVAIPGAPEEWPEEVIAEGRVVALRPHSAGLFITSTTEVVERGDRAVLRAGY
jgi:hypothetical protein